MNSRGEEYINYMKEQTKYYCDQCDKETKEAYEMPDGGYVCDSCYQDAVGRAEAHYDSMRDEGLI